MITDLNGLAAREVWGNSVLAWATALLVALVAAAGLKLLLHAVEGRLRRKLDEQDSGVRQLLADVAAGTRGWYLLLVGLAAGSLLLEIPGDWDARLRLAAILATLLQGGIWGNAAIGYAVRKFLEHRSGDPDDPGRQTGEALIRLLGQTIVWSSVVLLLLANLGFDITALVAGLGVGGIAIALALQSVLSDLFASVSILLDKPFRRGDFIIFGETVGSVERIGLKTTRIKSLWGEQIVVCNTDLLSSRIRNFKRMEERRIVFEVGVVYGTPAEKLERASTILREAVERQETARFDRAHFKGFGDFSLDYEVVFYVLSPDYRVYMDTQEKINLEIYRRFEQEGLEFAFPTRTLFVRKEEAA